MNAMGWWSGSDHVHMNYGGNLNNTPEYMLFEAKAEDLDHVGWKIANKDNRVFDTQYYKGEPLHSLSDGQYLISFGEEYRPAWYGHINFINLTKHLISPFTTAYQDTGIASLYPSNTDMFALARKQGAIGGHVHPFSREPSMDSEYRVAQTYAVDVALGSFEYLEVLTSARHYTATSKVWHRSLNCGFKVTASAGEDSDPEPAGHAADRRRPNVCLPGRKTHLGWMGGSGPGGPDVRHERPADPVHDQRRDPRLGDSFACGRRLGRGARDARVDRSARNVRDHPQRQSHRVDSSGLRQSESGLRETDRSHRKRLVYAQGRRPPASSTPSTMPILSPKRVRSTFTSATSPSARKKMPNTSSSGSTTWSRSGTATSTGERTAEKEHVLEQFREALAVFEKRRDEAR